MSRERLEAYKLRLLDTYGGEDLLSVLNIEDIDLVNKFEDKVLEYAEQEGWQDEDALEEDDYDRVYDEAQQA